MGLNKKIIIAIPARLESKRFPNKVLKNINGQPMLKRVLDRCSKCEVESEIIVCTDSEEIKKNVIDWGYEIKLTSKNCNSGSQRIASVIDELVLRTYGFKKDSLQKKNLEEILNNTLVINVQGDQPFINPKLISKIHESFIKNPQFEVITPVYKLNNDDIHDPNVVKTLISKNGKALYFSRSAIPHIRGIDPSLWYKHYSYWGHIGIYGYRASILSKWNSIPASKLEEVESLEQLRLIDFGINIDTFKTDSYSISVDTEEQFREACSLASKIEKRS